MTRYSMRQHLAFQNHTYFKLLAVALISLLANLACGAALAPRELLDARDAYAKAKTSPASKYALAQLETAKQALQEAEEAFRDGEDDEIPDLAYIAERQAQLAEAAGDLEQANQERAAALEEQRKAREEFQEFTQRSLSQAKADLDRTRREAEATKSALTEEQAKRLAAEKRAAAALASLQEMASVKEEKRGMVITLSGAVLFATGQSRLLAIAQQKLTEVAAALKDQGFKRITVEGHTDSRGSEAANQRLSEARASAVRSHMVSQGIDASKISAVGLGESRPIASNATSDGRANNRRVEIIVEPED
jgi:outer membrane protein OmpA-like peptidoglycan-associated protein